MKYYKASIDTPIGVKLKSLLAEAERCEACADKFAQKTGAIAYVGAVDVDFGGVSVFEFQQGSLPDLSMFEQIKSEDGIIWYAPKVEVKEQPMLSEIALQHKGDYGKIVPESEKTFREIAFMFSRREAAEMAGIILKESCVEEIVCRFKISPLEIRMLKSGAVTLQTIFPDCGESMYRRVSQSLLEDKQIMEVLGNRLFRIVISISGSRKAVQLYKQILALPVILRGTTNALLSIENPNSRSGIVEFGGHIYVCSGMSTTSSELQEVSEEEFMRMKNALESSIGGSVVAQA